MDRGAGGGGERGGATVHGFQKESDTVYETKQ